MTTTDQQIIVTMSQALSDLGASEGTLSAAQKQQLDDFGYVVLPGVLSRAEADRLVARLDALSAREGDAAGKDWQVEPGATRLGSLINKDPAFDVCFTHPLVLAAVNYIMAGDFGLSSITGRAAMPGEGNQGLHRDGQVRCANALWVASDFTPENGPTRLIPASHLLNQAPHEGMADPSGTHPDEIYLVAPAGTLVIINGWTWHGGTRNNSDAPRHLISAFWTPRGQYQPESNRRLAPDAQARLSEAALFVIDHEI